MTSPARTPQSNPSQDNPAQQSAVKTSTSMQELFAAASEILPGGVNSPVRAWGAVGDTPLFIQRGEGAYVWDEDGDRYLDYLASWGPLILGHCPPVVQGAIRDQLERGSSFGAPTRGEVELAQVLCEAIPSMEMVRMVSSGTEAVMSALRVARGATGRAMILKFSGCYHGHSDALLVQAGSGALTLGQPNSAGVTPAAVQDTVIAPYNDLPGAREAIRATGRKLAAVIVEPVAANMGLVPPREGFLEMLREETERLGALLIFDEIVTGFRVARGGYQQVCGITPDLTTLGKIIGGGLPAAAYGGRRDLMEQVAPSGPVYQAGTLSGNPLAVQAGLATLGELNTAAYERLEHLGALLENSLSEVLRRAPMPVRLTRVGSMWTLFFNFQWVDDYSTAMVCDTGAYGRFFHHMLARGIYLPPSQFETAFISLAHTEEEITGTVEAVAESLQQLTA